MFFVVCVCLFVVALWGMGVCVCYVCCAWARVLCEFVLCGVSLVGALCVCVCVSVCVCVARVHGLFVRCVVVLCVRVELCVFVPLGPKHQGPECIWARFWIAWVTFMGGIARFALGSVSS